MKYIVGICYGLGLSSLLYGIWTHFADSPVALGLYFFVPAVIFTLIAENE